MNSKKIELAKQTLKEAGYFVDNLWSLDDVKASYDCNDIEAHGILYDALTNEATMEQIWLAIDVSAESKGLIKKDDEPDNYCGICNGTGEGMQERSFCIVCNGSGIYNTNK